MWCNIHLLHLPTPCQCNPTPTASKEISKVSTEGLVIHPTQRYSSCLEDFQQSNRKDDAKCVFGLFLPCCLLPVEQIMWHHSCREMRFPLFKFTLADIPKKKNLGLAWCWFFFTHWSIVFTCCDMFAALKRTGIIFYLQEFPVKQSYCLSLTMQWLESVWA